ncbi:hypothetical protein J3E73DRAFT_396274 [Bipolaris maydis]|nr:hypothetical protein J3E73DRAFT_396274 [Bipolaris maydis]
MKFTTFVPFLLALGATAKQAAPVVGEAVLDLSANRPSHATLNVSDFSSWVPALATHAVSEAETSSSDCSQWWQGGQLAIIVRGSGNDCNRNQSCSIGGCKECGCSGCTK